MTLCTLYLHFELPDVHSLKGRRQVLNSVKERLKRLNISLLDISGEYPKEAELAIAFLAPDAAFAASLRERIEQILETHYPHYLITTDYEIL